MLIPRIRVPLNCKESDISQSFKVHVWWEIFVTHLDKSWTRHLCFGTHHFVYKQTITLKDALVGGLFEWASSKSYPKHISVNVLFLLLGEEATVKCTTAMKHTALFLCGEVSKLDFTFTSIFLITNCLFPLSANFQKSWQPDN